MKVNKYAPTFEGSNIPIRLQFALALFLKDTKFTVPTRSALELADNLIDEHNKQFEEEEKKEQGEPLPCPECKGTGVIEYKGPLPSWGGGLFSVVPIRCPFCIGDGYARVD